MSTATSHLHTEGPEGPREPADAVDQLPEPAPAPAPRPVVVRRNAGLSALVGAAASAVAIAYLRRATQSGAPLDWVVCAVVALIAAVHLKQLVDARTPLLVVDELGIRVRLGHQWRGLPWDAIGQVRVQPARGPLHDGRLMFAPHSLGRALDGLDTRGRRAAALNQRTYGAALAVPLGLATRAPARGSALADCLSTLAAGRTDVVLGEPVERTERTERTPRSERTRRTRRAAAADGPSQESGATAVPDAPPAGEVVALPGWAASHGRSADDVAEVAEVAADGASADADRAWAEHPVAPADDAADPADDWDDRPDDGWNGDADDASQETSAPEVRVRRRSLLGRVGTTVSRVGRGRGRDVDTSTGVDVEPADRGEDAAPSDQDPAQPAGAAGAPAAPPIGWIDDQGADDQEADDREADDREADDQAADDHGVGTPQVARPAARGALPFRDARQSLRAQIRHGRSAPVLGSAALLPDAAGGASSLPESSELRRPRDPDDDDRVRPISTLGEPVEPLVVDDFVTEPAYDPVIGPELAAARTRVGLSVDELAERTRIRPHVIESIEVDDFAPCGGDFYARGHLRTLARVLGRDPARLLEQFEKRYATAPISAKRVFEAELATGMTGSMRSTVSGPNWLLLVGVVLALVLTWGVVRLFSSEPTETLQPVPALNGSAGIAAPQPDGRPAVAPVTVPLRVELVGAHAATQAVVRDRAGTVVWAGRIDLGGRRTVRATPPVTVDADDAGAVEVTVAGVDKGPLGQLGQPGARTFHRPG